MKKNILFFILTIVMTIIICGCTTKYERGDINNYIKSQIGISGYELADTYFNKSGDDNYYDDYWLVKYGDIEFYVINDFYYGMESVSNKLTSTFDYAVVDYYLNKYSNAYKLNYSENPIMSGKMFTLEGVYDSDKNIDEIKLKQCYDDIVEFLNTIDFKKYPVDLIEVTIHHDNSFYRRMEIYKENHICSFEEFKES